MTEFKRLVEQKIYNVKLEKERKCVRVLKLNLLVSINNSFNIKNSDIVLIFNEEGFINLFQLLNRISNDVDINKFLEFVKYHQYQFIEINEYCMKYGRDLYDLKDYLN